MSGSTQTVRATTTQLSDSAQVLARAFYDDPLIKFWVPNDAQRLAALPWFMKIATGYGLKYGEVETTAGSVEGTAIWLPPGATHIPTMRMLAAGMYAVPFKFGLGGTLRFLESLDYLEKLHQEAVPEGHYYLMFLGVDPPRQGKGIGGALMAPVLARADDAKIPCYLEIQKEANLVFYRRHGFEVVTEGDLPNGGPHYWTMKRLPR